MSKIKELNERRAAIVADMKAITTAAEQRSEAALTAEEREKFNKLVEERNAIDADLEIYAAMEAEDMRNAKTKVEKRAEDSKAKLEERAFFKMLASKDLDAEERAALTMSNSGIVVPNTIQQDVLLGLQGNYGILSAIDLRYTDDAGTMTFPYLISDLTLQKVAIGGTATEGAAQWSGIQLTANDFSLPIIPVSETLLAAADVDVRAYLVELFTELIRKGLSDRIINSGDDNKDFKAFGPQVKSATAASATALAYTDIINLMAKVKAPYRNLDRASFAMSPATKDALVGMVDKNGRPIYIESMSAGVPDKLFGFPVVIDDAIADIAPKARVMYYGDFNAYKARITKGVRIKTYDESKYSVQGCIGMQAFVAGDGRLIYEDGKIEPIAALAMA